MKWNVTKLMSVQGGMRTMEQWMGLASKVFILYTMYIQF